MKWVLYITIASVALVIAMSLMRGFPTNENKSEAFPKPTLQAENPTKPINSSSSVPVYSSSPASPTPSAKNLSKRESWQTYRDEKYKFEIQYSEKEWVLTAKTSSPPLPSYATVQEPINFYTARNVPIEGPISAPITIAIYEKPSTTINEWLSKGYGTDLSKITKGGVETALSKAYDYDETGVVSYNDAVKDGVNIYEVGRVSTTYNSLSFATFFVKESLLYVYEVSFHLPGYGPTSKITPSDSEYIESYKRVLVTFKFTDLDSKNSR